MKEKAEKAGSTRRKALGNGKRRRTPQQLERQEKVFFRHIQGATIRELAREFGCAQQTIISDIRHEGERRADELAERREFETARAVAVYEDIMRRARTKGDMYDSLLTAGSGEERGGVRVTDRTLDTELHARERIDKILGIDAPVKVDVKMQEFIDALLPQEGEEAVRV